MNPSDQSTLREVLNGWHIVRTGSARIGDRWWRSSTKSAPGYWLPVTGADWQGEPVLGEGMPVLIRKD
jgi:hypothetical protein